MALQDIWPVQTSIRHLVHTERSLKFDPIQTVHGHIWFMWSGLGQDKISQAFWHGSSVFKNILDRKKYNQISWIFWQRLNIFMDVLGRIIYDQILRTFVCCVFSQSCPTLCGCLDSSSARLLCPCDSLGKDAGLGCPFILQGIFPT